MDFDVLDVSEAVANQPQEPLIERIMAYINRAVRLMTFLATGTIGWSAFVDGAWRGYASVRHRAGGFIIVDGRDEASYFGYDDEGLELEWIDSSSQRSLVTEGLSVRAVIGRAKGGFHYAGLEVCYFGSRMPMSWQTPCYSLRGALARAKDLLADWRISQIGGLL